MDAKQYAVAKKLFFELVDKSPEEQAARLHELECTNRSIAEEVTLLLANNSSRTLIENSDHPRSTSLGTGSFRTLGWIRLNRYLFGGIVPLVAAIVTTLFMAAAGMYLHHEMYKRSKSDFEKALSAATDQKVRRVLQWINWHKRQVQSWGMRDDIQSLVRDLDHDCRTIANLEAREATLRGHQAQFELERIFQSTPFPIGIHPYEETEGDETKSRSPRIKYAIWNTSFQLLADWQYENESVHLGEPASANGKVTISNVFETKKILAVLPQPHAGTITKGYPLEISSGYVMFFIPIYAKDSNLEPDADPVAVMMIRSDLFYDELKEILSDLIFSDSNCYLVTKNGAIATPVRDYDAMLNTLSSLPSVNATADESRPTILFAKDPGTDLLSGEKPFADRSEWPLTVASQVLTNQQDGHNFTGYRDYRGKIVVGAWRWMEAANVGMILEIPLNRAYGNLQFISRAFLFMTAIPFLIAVVLIAFSIVRFSRISELSNRTVGAYRLREKLGEGGLGVVYAGEHSMLGRRAAIKLIKPGSVTSSAVRRFEREVRLSSMLNHQNAIGIYDFGVSKEGLLYCAMELVDGASLAQILSFDPHQPFDRIVHILHQTSRALAEAHELQLVHRDIKPQNVMICRNPIPDVVKVVDFGLAKSISETISRDVTATKAVMGTPGFIAPERLESPWSADPKIDIFSFGVLGMYMLAAKVPSLGVTKKSFLEMIHNPTIQKRVNEPHVQRLIDLMVQSASTNAEDRPSNMRSISEELREMCLAHPWSRDRAEVWWMECEEPLRKWTMQKRDKPASVD